MWKWYKGVFFFTLYATCNVRHTNDGTESRPWYIQSRSTSKGIFYCISEAFHDNIIFLGNTTKVHSINITTKNYSRQSNYYTWCSSAWFPVWDQAWGAGYQWYSRRVQGCHFQGFNSCKSGRIHRTNHPLWPGTCSGCNNTGGAE